MESINHNEPGDHITNNDPNENAQDNEEVMKSAKQHRQVLHVSQIPSISVNITMDNLQLEMTASSYQPGDALGMIKQTLQMFKEEQLLGKQR